MLQHEINRLRAYIGDEISKKQERTWQDKVIEEQEKNKVRCTGCSRRYKLTKLIQFYR